VSIRTLSAPNRSGIYRGPALCRVSGISYRQLDYWDRTGLLSPSVTPAIGSGYQRLYSREDLVLALAIRRLLRLGVSLQSIRALAEPGLPGDSIGLREAVRRRRRRWSATVSIGDLGGAGIWLDLAPLWRLAEEGDPESELRAPPPAA
jgi:DNA-binding transcriptional MerR regulator